MDSHDGHDLIEALFRHGDVEERVLAGEGFGDPFSGNSARGIHICHIEQRRKDARSQGVWNDLSRCSVEKPV